MTDSNLRLDGNAAGGLLNEIFPFEMTAAERPAEAAAKRDLSAN